jgi:hypothetical protein
VARSLINMPEGQIIGSGSESESSEKRLKKEKKQQKEQEKEITKD